MGNELDNAVRKLCLAFPETEELISHGMPNFRVRGAKIFATYAVNHHGDRRIALLLNEERWRVAFWVGGHAQLLMTDDPRYTIPPYMGHNGWISLDVAKKHSERELQSLELEGYGDFALKRMLG